MSKQIRSIILILCITLLAVGCGGGTSQSTPKETFDGFKDAVSKEDWKTAFKYLTEDSQDRLLGSLVIGGGISVAIYQDEGKEKAFEKVLKKHGVTKPDNQKIPDGDIQTAMRTLAAGVKDKGACFQELMKFMKDVSEYKDGDSGLVRKIKIRVFKDFKIDGDIATATLTVDGKDEINPMTFKKVKGKWFIDLIGPEEEAGGSR